MEKNIKSKKNINQVTLGYPESKPDELHVLLAFKCVSLKICLLCPAEQNHGKCCNKYMFDATHICLFLTSDASWSISVFIRFIESLDFIYVHLRPYPYVTSYFLFNFIGLAQSRIK